LLDRLRGEARLIRGDLEEAAAAFGAGLVAAREAGSEFDVLLLLRAEDALRERRGESSSPSGNAEADTIAERLGIVSAPATASSSI
jgi:hypothetical protein